MFCNRNPHPLLEAQRAGEVVYIDDPDEDFQAQLAAANYRAQQLLLNDREWLDDGELAELAASEAPQFSPTFWLMVRLWILILVIALAVTWYITGAHHMQGPNNTPPAPAAAPESKGEPHGKSLQAALDRFGNAVVTIATHPDNGMFFFDAKDLVANRKIDSLKFEALLELLCARGLIDRRAFEDRLEDKLNLRAKALEDGAKRLALTALITPGAINGGGH